MADTGVRLAVPFVDLRAQHAALADEIEPRLREIMAGAQFILGPDVAAFEEEFAAYYGDRRAGTLGHAAAFSFYPAKNLGAYGDAGALTTNDAALADKVRMLRDYGQRAKYDHQLLAYNRRLDTLQAAVLRVKLRHLDAWNEARQAHAARYREGLAGTGVIAPAEVRAAGGHVYHLHVIRHPDRDGLQRALTA